MSRPGAEGLDPEDGALLFDYWRPTASWVRVNLFRLIDAGIGAAVLREGDARRGAVLILLAGPEGGGRLLGQVRKPSGACLWIPLHRGDALSAGQVEATLRRLAAQDPDLWILTIDAASYGARAARPDAHGEAREGAPVPSDALLLAAAAMARGGSTG